MEKDAILNDNQLKDIVGGATILNVDICAGHKTKKKCIENAPCLWLNDSCVHNGGYSRFK